MTIDQFKKHFRKLDLETKQLIYKETELAVKTGKDAKGRVVTPEQRKALDHLRPWMVMNILTGLN